MTICVCVSISPLKTWTCFILYSKGQLDKTCSSKLPHPSGTERDYTSFSFFPPFCCYRLHPTPHLCYCPICTYCSLFSSGKPIIADLRVKCLPRDVPGAGLNQHCVNSSAKACNGCRFTCKRSTSSLSWNEVTKSNLTL